jgi:hypothetical protein
VIQQSIIMHKNGAKIELFDNLRDTIFKKKVPNPVVDKKPGKDKK